MKSIYRETCEIGWVSRNVVNYFGFASANGISSLTHDNFFSNYYALYALVTMTKKSSLETNYSEIYPKYLNYG